MTTRRLYIIAHRRRLAPRSFSCSSSLVTERHPFETTTPVALLTGATSGIGRVTARFLVQRGFALTFLARDQVAAARLVQELTALGPKVPPRAVHCDLASLGDVAKCAASLAQSLPKLHLLVHNAGCCFQERRLTPDGREQTWTVNQLAPFLLTQTLMPSLRAAQDPSSPSRVVVVASQAHRRGRLHLGDPHAHQRSYHGYLQYASSKLANVMWTRMLDEKVKDQGVRAYSLHPGVVNTKIADNMRGLFGLFFKAARPLLKTPAQGAQTLLTLACTPSLPDPADRYFINDRPAQVSLRAQSKARSKALWRICEQECAQVKSA